MRGFLLFPLLLVACAPDTRTSTEASANVSANENGAAPAAIHWVSVAQKEAIPTAAAADLSTLVAGDFNHDGKGDAVLVHPTDLRTFLGTESGPLEALAQGAIDDTAFPQAHLVSCLAADIDGDKNLDLIGMIHNEDPTTPSWMIVSMSGNGDGTFALPPAIVTTDTNAIDFVVADFDADTHADILLRTAIDDATILFGKADGTFEAPAQASLPHVNDDDAQMRVADVNGDLRPDVVFLDATNAVAASYLNEGGRVLPLKGVVAYDQKPDPALDLALADMNGDKLADLLVLGTTSLERFDSHPSVAPQGDDATPTVGYDKPVSSALAASHIEHIADFDGDSQLDAFISLGDGSVVLARTIGGATWKPSLAKADATFKSGTKHAFGDFDGDGREDVIVLDDQSKTTSLVVLHATSAPPTTPTTEPIGDSTSPKTPNSNDPSNGWTMGENPIAPPAAAPPTASDGCNAAPGTSPSGTGLLAVALALLFARAQRKKGKTC